MSGDALWTLDQLVGLVGSALSTDYDGAVNGRVREMPDRRTVRWYTSIGLVDRPGVMRGRSALYGTRQLLQLVAVKRRQAAGRSLAQIQQELAGATDATLGEIAQIPAAVLAGQSGAAPDPAPPVRHRFWLQPASSPDPSRGATAQDTAAVPGRPAEPVQEAADPDECAASPAILHGVRLADGLTLLLPADAPAPTGADLAAVRAAAQPLVETLVQRGLMSIPRFGGAR